MDYYKLNEDATEDTRFDPDIPYYFDEDDTKRFPIGVFSTRELAEEAKQLLLTQPGFRRDTLGFRIEERILDRVAWAGGFYTELSSGEIVE